MTVWLSDDLMGWMMGIRFQAHIARSEANRRAWSWYLTASVIAGPFLPEFRNCFLPALRDPQTQHRTSKSQQSHVLPVYVPHRQWT